MKNSILLAVVLCLMAPLALAEDAPDPLIDKFVNDYYKAMRGNELESLRSLIHPKSLACIDKVSHKYFRQDLSLSDHNLKASPPSWKPIDLTAFKSAPEFAQLPVTPEKGIQISWQEGNIHHVNALARMLLLTQVDGRYVEVSFCLNAEQVKKRNEFFARKKAAK